MKNIISCFLISIIVSILSYGQVIDKISNVEQSNSMSNYSMLSTKKYLSKVIYYWNGNHHATSYYTYTDDLKLDEVLIDFVPSGPPDSKSNIVYNDNGLKENLKMFSRNTDTAAWEPYSIRHYMYDLNSSLLSETTKSIKGTIEENIFRYLYKYDSGDIYEKKHQYWENEQWNSDYKDTYYYNEDKIIQNINEDSTANGWEIFLKVDYLYENDTLRKKIYDWGNDSDFRIIEYLINGNLETELWYYSNSKEDTTANFRYEMQIDRLFDSDGDLINEKTYYWDDEELNSFILSTEKVYEYSDSTEITSVANCLNNVDSEFRIQNYPNPFNPITTISYTIPKSSLVKIKIYDILGNEITEIENGFKQTGNHQVIFNAQVLTSGMYFYRIETNNLSITKKMLLLK